MSFGQAAGFGQPIEAPLKRRGIRRRLAGRHDRRRAKGPPARRIDRPVEAARTSRRARSESEVGQAQQARVALDPSGDVFVAARRPREAARSQRVGEIATKDPALVRVHGRVLFSLDFRSGQRRVSEKTDQLPLRAGVAVDVALGRPDRPVPREQLDVAQAAARAMDVAGGDGDEAAPAGVRRAALEAELLEKRREPVDDAARPEVRAAIRADHRPDRFRVSREPLQGAPQVGMHRDAPPAALLRDDVADVERAGDATLRVEDHRPIEAGDLAGAAGRP